MTTVVELLSQVVQFGLTDEIESLLTVESVELCLFLNSLTSQGFVKEAALLLMMFSNIQQDCSDIPQPAVASDPLQYCASVASACQSIVAKSGSLTAWMADRLELYFEGPTQELIKRAKDVLRVADRVVSDARALDRLADALLDGFRQQAEVTGVHMPDHFAGQLQQLTAPLRKDILQRQLDKVVAAVDMLKKLSLKPEEMAKRLNEQRIHVDNL